MREIVAAIFEKWNLIEVLINVVNSKLMYLLSYLIFLQDSTFQLSPDQRKNMIFFFCPCQIWELWNDHKRVISLRLLDLGKYRHAISLCIFTEQNLDISIKLVTVKEVLRQLKCSNSFIVGRGLLTIAEGEKSRPHSRGRRLRELTLRLTWATNFDEK